MIPILFCSFLVSAVFPQTNLETHWEQENWTAGMKNVEMTTFDRGLIIRIDLRNLDTENYVEIPYLRIKIETTYEETDSKDSYYIELKNIEIKPSNTISFWHNVDLGHSLSDKLGSWSLRVAYVTHESSYDYNNKILPYPFEFTLATEDELQRAIKDNPSAPVFNIYLPEITISLFSVGSVAVIIFLLFKKKKRGR